MKNRHHIYLTKADESILNRLAQQRNESKSAVVRKLIHVEKYTQTLNVIENHSRVIAEFLLEFHHIGINLNQIAYHLNINLSKQQAQSDIEKIMQNFKTEMEEIKKQIKNLKIKINVEHTKTPKKEETQDE